MFSSLPLTNIKDVVDLLGSARLLLVTRQRALMDTYDLYEMSPGGPPLWRCSTRGLSEALAKLQQLGQASSNEFYVIHLLTKEIVGRVNAPQ